MSSDIGSIIQLGYDIISNKYYGTATATILFYDHLLTLGDEAKYAWSGKKSWVFWLLIFNRYFPMSCQFWHFAVAYGSHFNTEHQLPRQVCDRTAFYTMFTAVVCNLVAQVVLTLRIYAVTMASIPVTVGFAIIATSQLGLGMWAVVLAALQGASYSPLVPLDTYRICSLVEHKGLLLACISVALFYDFLAFSLVLFLAIRSKVPGFKGPRILGTIADDAVRYFLVIFTTHFVFEMTLLFGREAIQLLPACGSFTFLPVMISRIMLSLRKAVDPQKDVWSLAGPPRNDETLQSIKFVRKPQSSPSERDDDIPLDTYTES